MLKKKILVVATTLIALGVSTAHAQRNYGHNYNNSAAWNSAAIGAAGMITGAIISGIMQNNANQNAQSAYRQGYGGVYYPAPATYGPPLGAVPVYPNAHGMYYQPQACVTQRVPQYDIYGRLVQFVQVCAN
jgi:hypothetical protein